jgi:hypothetical protein
MTRVKLLQFPWFRSCDSVLHNARDRSCIGEAILTNECEERGKTRSRCLPICRHILGTLVDEDGDLTTMVNGASYCREHGLQKIAL